MSNDDQTDIEKLDPTDPDYQKKLIALATKETDEVDSLIDEDDEANKTHSEVQNNANPRSPSPSQSSETSEFSPSENGSTDTSISETSTALSDAQALLTELEDEGLGTDDSTDTTKGDSKNIPDSAQTTDQDDPFHLPEQDYNPDLDDDNDLDLPEEDHIANLSDDDEDFYDLSDDEDKPDELGKEDQPPPEQTMNGSELLAKINADQQKRRQAQKTLQALTRAFDQISTALKAREDDEDVLVPTYIKDKDTELWFKRDIETGKISQCDDPTKNGNIKYNEQELNEAGSYFNPDKYELLVPSEVRNPKTGEMEKYDPAKHDKPTPQNGQTPTGPAIN